MHCKLYLPNGWQTRITLHLANIKWITGLTTPPLSSLTLAVFWPNTCSNHFKVGTRFGTREWKAGTATRRKQSSRQRMYRLVRKKYDSFKLKIFINEKFWKIFYFFPAFYLIMWLMISPKNFEKIVILKIWQLFSSEVSKLTSANYPWNKAFSGMTKIDFQQYCPCNTYCAY